MKNDREFLEGIYKKAEILEREKFKRRKTYNNFIKYSSVAAIFIILPLLLFNNQIFKSNNIDLPIEPRIMNVIDPISNFNDAEYVLIGTTKKIGKNNILISLDEIFYGDLGEKEIHLDTSNIMSIKFKKGERNLFFLNKDDKYYLTYGVDSMFKEIENNVFEDSYGNKYDLEDIKNNIDRRQINEKNN